MPALRAISFFFILLSCFWFINCPAQTTSTIDSLENDLRSASEDTNKVKTLNRLGFRLRYMNNKHDKALQYENEALSLAKKLNYTRGVAFAYRNCGYIYIAQGKLALAVIYFDSCLSYSNNKGYKPGIAMAYQGLGWTMTDSGKPSEGIEYYNKALRVLKEIEDIEGVEDTYVIMGNNYFVTGNYPEALNSFMTCLRSAEKRGFRGNVVSAYFGISLVYTSQRNYSEALEYYRKALRFYEEMNDMLTIAYVYNNMGLIYKEIGNYSEAMKYFKESHRLKEELGDIGGTADALACMGTVCLAQGHYREAMKYFQMALKCYQGLNITSGFRIGTVYIFIGQTLLKEAINNKVPASGNQYAEAIKYLNKGLSIAKSMGDKESVKNGYLGLSQADSARGDFRTALEHHKLFVIYKDSLLDEVSQNRMSDIRLGYETEKRDREIELLASEKKLKEEQVILLKSRSRMQLMLMFVSIGGIALLLLVVFFIIKSRRKLTRAYLLLKVQKEELTHALEKLKRTQSQLIQSEKMASLGMLTAGIAHEINNPVNFINSGVISLQKDYEDLQRYLQTIGEQFPGARKLAQDQGVEELMKIIPQTIEDIQTGVQRTSEIVKGLRNFTRMDTAEMKEADIHEGIESTLLLLNSRIKDRITLVKTFDPEIGFIRCYPGPLNQVFMNLLSNAIDAIYQKVKSDEKAGLTAENPYQIIVATKLTGQGVKITITDNGAGIPEEIQGKIFDPFFTTKEVGKGTGLGLSICLGIIEKHGGTIDFESKVNEGSAFTITLPA